MDIKTDREEKRNFRYALLNGIFASIGFRLVDSNMILSAFVKQLTNSNIMVGLTSAISNGGWMWPQLIMSNLLEHRPRKMPFYTFGITIRIISWTLIPLLTLLIGDHNHSLLFICFFTLYFASCSSLGVSSIPFNDIVAKTIPAHRIAKLFSVRQLIGEIFGIGVGFFIRYVLSDGFVLSFPHNYTIIFGFSVIMMTISSYVFILIKEPIHPVRKERQPFWQHLKSGPHFLRTDKNYKGFWFYRVASSFGSMCIPFYVTYALDRLRVSPSTIGLFTAAGAASAMLSNLFWGYVGERHGSRYLMIAASSLACAAPIIAASVVLLPSSLQIIFYFLVFIINQAFISGSNIAYMTYSLNMAPSMSRPTYLGFLNTIMFPMSFVPILAGTLLKIISYEFLFIISACMSAIAIYFATYLVNLGDRSSLELRDNY